MRHGVRVQHARIAARRILPGPGRRLSAHSVGQLLADGWATATAERTTRGAGEPGVRLRCYLDLRQPLSPVARDEAPPLVSAAASQRRRRADSCPPRPPPPRRRRLAWKIRRPS
ncbi:DUF6207 family protein [Streptomyces sp. NBC_00299]|uniref:DUF6207 family protein n=1 Tax=Streptomyces sp. NBC_00299 TaxID=2975705 RepID=UPI002E2A6F26|nr:DUF6207 family protein [Streptomyces sp. NBC_00299]